MFTQSQELILFCPILLYIQNLFLSKQRKTKHGSCQTHNCQSKASLCITILNLYQLWFSLAEPTHQFIILLCRSRLPNIIAPNDFNLWLFAELNIVLRVRRQKFPVNDACDRAIIVIACDLRLVGERRDPPVRGAPVGSVEQVRDWCLAVANRYTIVKKDRLALVVAHLKIIDSRILKCRSPILGSAFNSIIELSRRVPIILHRRIHLKDRIGREQRCICLHLDPKLGLSGPWCHIQRVPWHIIRTLRRRNQCKALTIAFLILRTHLVNKSVNVALREVVSPLVCLCDKG